MQDERDHPSDGRDRRSPPAPLRPSPRPLAQIGQGVAATQRLPNPEPGRLLVGGVKVLRPPPQVPRPVPGQPRPSGPVVHGASKVDAETGGGLTREDVAALADLDGSAKVDARTPPPSGAGAAPIGGGSSKVDAATGIDELPEAFPAPKRLPPIRGKPGPKIPIHPSPTRERVGMILEGRKQALGTRAGDRGGTASEPTRSAQTEASYRRRGDLLVQRFRRERNLDADADQFSPSDFAIWCLSLRAGLKPPSWRYYRQSAIMALQPFPDSEWAIEMLQRDAPGEIEMGTSESVPAVDGERRTSANKEKRFAFEDFKRVEAALQLKRRSSRADILRDWLRAGIATGLRPIEWRATDVVEVNDPNRFGVKRQFLLVLNAKATNERGNGVVRTLDITDFSDDAIASVRRMSAVGAKAYAEMEFGNLHSHCGNILYEICQKFWGRRKLSYSLYSCRHQFIANMKSLGLANEEVSALAGHVVDTTAAEVYGKKRSAWSPDKIVDRPRALPEEIATVRKRLVLHEERLDLIHLVEKGRPRTPPSAEAEPGGDPSMV